MTGKHLANKHQTDSLPVRFGGKEGTEELCFSLFCYTGAIIYHFNRGEQYVTELRLWPRIVNKGHTKETEAKLFSPFFSTKPNGQGIGLVFIREVLTRHGCTFSLRTYSDGLTRFRIIFP